MRDYGCLSAEEKKRGTSEGTIVSAPEEPEHNIHYHTCR